MMMGIPMRSTILGIFTMIDTIKKDKTMSTKTMSTKTSTGAATRIRPFSAVPTMIPEFSNGVFTGRVYKVERKLFYNGIMGAREHLWLLADPRIHSHPWTKIRCVVMNGWYKAKEYSPDENGKYVVTEVFLQAGDAPHDVPENTFHQVYEVLPGTVSMMFFTEEVEGGPSDWGHLIPDGYRYEKVVNTPSVPGQPGFFAALQHLNPHLRPRLKDPEGRVYPSGVVDPHWVDVYQHMSVPTLDQILKSVDL